MNLYEFQNTGQVKSSDILHRMGRLDFLKKCLGFGVMSAFPGILASQTLRPPVSSFKSNATAESVTKDMDLTGKSFLITGSNSGLGFEAARVLARRGATVYAAARTAEKAENTARNLSGDVRPAVCELTDFRSVIQCAESIQKEQKSLDAVLCNAGIMALPDLALVYGLEKQFVVNYLGHFLLVQKLLPLLNQSPDGRIVLVSSGLYNRAPEGGIEFDNLDGKKSYDPFTAYGQSKLAMILFAREFSKQFSKSSVTANALYPGVIHTNLFHQMPWYQQLLIDLFGWAFIFNKTIEEGAATHCYLASHPSLKTVSGHLFYNCNPVNPEGAFFHDEKLGKELWDFSMEFISRVKI